jgi:hypothetical protein
MRAAAQRGTASVIRAWWDRTMDGQRLLAVAGTLAGFAIFVLGAAALGIRFGLENSSGAIGAAMGPGSGATSTTVTGEPRPQSPGAWATSPR